MIIDDSDESLYELETFLGYKGYDVLITRNSTEALSKMKEKSVDVVLIRTIAPNFSDEDVIKDIKRKGSFVMLMLPKYPNNEIFKKAAQIGIDDFIVGPVDFQFLEYRIMYALKVRYFFECKITLLENLAKDLSDNEKLINELFRENLRLSFETLEILSHISELKDYETHEHTTRVGIVSSEIAEAMDLDPTFISKIRFAAPLHDIGKLLISNQILAKPGRLTKEEWELVKKHPKMGWEILRKSSSDILKLAANIALTHHERWNGTGYPLGLRGEEIPIEGRIVAIADSFDAMVSKRPYKKAKSLQEAFSEIERFSGEFYDPKVVKAFLSCKEKILKLYKEEEKNDKEGNRKNSFRSEENV